MSDRKWSFKLRFFSIVNFFIALLAAIIQIVIFSQGRDNYIKVGAGIWAGILFGIVGVALWIISVKGSRNAIIFGVGIISTVLAIIASIAMIATSAYVIHEETHNPLIQDKRLFDAITSPSPPRIDNKVDDRHPLLKVFDDVREHGSKIVQKVANKVQHELCNTFFDNNCNVGALSDFLAIPSSQTNSRETATVPKRIPGTRIALESVLLTCGVITFIINVFATCTQVMMIDDPVTMA